MTNAEQRVLRRWPSLLLVTGKGGVGKTTLSCVLATSCSDAGRNTLLLELDPRESAHRMLGIPPSGGEVERAGHRLWLRNLQPRTELDALVEDRLKISAISRRVLQSPVYRHFAEGCPGLKELAVLGHALRCLRGELMREEEIDQVVLDAPATGHGLSLLAAPELVAEAIESGPFGRLAGELAELVGDPERCGVVAVTAAEEMPVDETLELLDALEERMDRAPELLVVNGLYPEIPEGFEPRDEIDRLWIRRRKVNRRESRRLSRRWSGPRIDLERRPIDRSPELIEGLRRRLEAQLEGVAV